MDRFVLEKGMPSSWHKSDERGAYISKVHLQRHYCSLKGIIEDVPARVQVRYTVADKGVWSEFKLAAGTSNKELESSEWGIHFNIGVKFAQKYGNVQFLAFFNGPRLMLVPLFLNKEIDKGVVEAMERCFYLFDYTQSKAMKEKHRIEKVRRQAQKKEQVTSNAPEAHQAPGSIKITDGIQYLYKYEEKEEAVRHMTCELWSVRGHYRHYKSGKVSYIAPYQKGKARKEKIATGHIYEIVEEVR